jgi:thiol-disulfide isomerase/thioredoxin
MKKRSLLLILFCFYTSILFSQSGIQFFKGSWYDAKLKAKTENKEIYLDCYTTWCGPCKKMEYEVFTDTAIANYYNDHYICYHMDMEAGEGVVISKVYEVNVYPTHLFFNSNGDLVHRESGFKEAGDFLQLGKDGIDPNTQSGKFWFEYEKGNRDPKFLLEYTEYLQKEHLNYDKVFDEYILSVKKEPVDSHFLKKLFKYTASTTSHAYKLFQQYEPQLKQRHGELYLSNKYRYIIVPYSINIAVATKNDSLFYVIEKIFLEKVKVGTEENVHQTLLYPYLRKSSQYQKYFDTLEYIMQKETFGGRTFEEMTRLVKEQPDHELLRNGDNVTEVKHCESQKSAVGNTLACTEYYNSLAYWMCNYARGFIFISDDYNSLTKGTLKWVKLSLAIQERNKEKDAPVYEYYEVLARIYLKLKDYENAYLYAKKAEKYATDHKYPSDEMMEIMDIVQEIKGKM